MIFCETRKQAKELARGDEKIVKVDGGLYGDDLFRIQRMEKSKVIRKGAAAPLSITRNNNCSYIL